MPDLKHREAKMQEARKNTPWREFVKEICSWQPLVFHRHKDVVSRYPFTSRISGVINSQKFDIQRTDNKVGQNYNMDKSFFKQLGQLFQQTQRPAMRHFDQVENCQFADTSGKAKNVYLGNTVAFDAENVAYSFFVRDNVSNVYNSVMVQDQCDNIYFCTGIVKSFNVFYSKFTENSANIRFSNNLTGCKECLFCNNLYNQSYCINNKQYSKEEYVNEKQEVLKSKEEFNEKMHSITSKGNNVNSNNVEGSMILHSQDITNGFGVYRVHKGRNLIFSGDDHSQGDKNIYDAFIGGSGGSDHNYGLMSGGFGSHLYNIINTAFGSHVYYSKFLTNCSYCFGCIGLKNKSFCILNKQYSKEERFQKANEIFAQMEQDGQLGKFFPASMNPFYFNDTVAYLIDDSFTKEEVEKEGFMRRDEEIKVDIPEGVDKVKTTELDQYEGFDADGNWKIDPEILKKVIIDEKGNAYKIVKMEYDFLMKHGLPLPRLHRLERIKLGFQFK